MRGGRSTPSKMRSRAGPFSWVWRTWPVLVVAFFLVVWIMAMLGVMGPRSIDTPQLRTGQSRVQGGRVRLSDLIAAGIQLSEIAAHEIIDVKQGGREEAQIKGQTEEGVDEPVTVADARSNSVFVNGLRQLFPGLPILSEESDPKPAALDIPKLHGVDLEEDPWLRLEDLLVTVDPLDATKEFTENLVHYVTTMVCVVHRGRPIAGIINEPFMRGHGAIWGVSLESGYKMLRGMTAKAAEGEAKSTVVISRSHTGEGGDVVSRYITRHKPLFAGGSGYKALRVLQGDAVAYLHVTKIKSWDVCAADALVHSAGGEFTDLKGKSIEYKRDRPVLTGGLIATADPASHETYIRQLAGYEMPKHHHR